MGKIVGNVGPCDALFLEKDKKITIALPVYEEPDIVANFIDGNKEILEKYPVIVVDRKGGEALKKYASFYKKTSCPTIGLPLGNSRKFLIGRVQTEFTLNLDADVLLPKNFVKESLKKFEDPEVAVVALDYENPQGHLAFGPSIWRTEILQKLYDWQKLLKRKKCECIHMWSKVQRAKYRVETLGMSAKHVRSGDKLTRPREKGFLDRSWTILSRLYRRFKKKLLG
jgi:cellulose synthase/poly-beta-1,6-N-acetylglucosamine synthase-like glycosyltransferase